MKRRICGFLPAFFLGLLCTASVPAEPKFIAALNWDQVFEFQRSGARGTCTAKVLKPSGYMDVTCAFSGLSSDVIAADVYWRWAGQDYQICHLLTAAGPSGNVSTTCHLPYGPPPWSQSLLDKQLSVLFRTQSYPGGELRGQLKIVALDHDVDGDGRTDASVFRPASSTSWARSSTTLAAMERQFPGYYWDNRPLAADFDGDGMADLASCHIDWNTGEWLWIYTRSGDNTLMQTSWGNEWLNDQEAYGDFDGDGRMDVAVFRQDSGVWYIVRSSDGQAQYDQWGTLGDRAVPADYDKDGKTDLAVVREEAGKLAWYVRRSSDDTYYRIEWGLATDQIFPNMPADVDGDGATDIVVARDDLTGSRTDPVQRYFYALRSSDQNWMAIPWGVSTDGVRLGDYDGDGRTDFAAIRNIDGHLTWFVTPSTKSETIVFNWGLAGDQ